MFILFGGEVFIDFIKEKDIVSVVVKVINGGVYGIINVFVFEVVIEVFIRYVRVNGIIVLVGMLVGVKCCFDVFNWK